MFYLCRAAVGVGFYGNEQTRRGVDTFTAAAEDATRTVDHISYQVCVYSLAYTLIEVCAYSLHFVCHAILCLFPTLFCSGIVCP